MNLPANTLQSTGKGQGWQAHLNLSFERSSVRTVLQRSQHYGPLRVQRPFYPEGDLAHIYILHPPGGVVGGDQLNISVTVCKQAQVLCTTPGSGKFYLSAGDCAYLNQTFKVKAASSLEWLPQENILFAGARLRSRTRIIVEDDAVFIGCDISCLGRPMSNEIFDQGTFDSRVEFYFNKRLLLVENLRVPDKESLFAATGLRGYAVQATMLAFPCTEEQLALVRKQIEDEKVSELLAATLFDGLLVVRALASDSQKVKQQFISIWQTLRPGLLNRPACLPRIWAT